MLGRNNGGAAVFGKHYRYQCAAIVFANALQIKGQKQIALFDMLADLYLGEEAAFLEVHRIDAHMNEHLRAVRRAHRKEYTAR